MNRREKMLAAIVGLMVLAFIANRMYGKYRDALQARSTAVEEANKRLMAVDRQMRQGRAAVRQMQQWQARSLPADQETALTLYKAWLIEKAKAAGLDVIDIKPPARSGGVAAYKSIGYAITAKGSLPNVAALLYEFYRSPQLHQVTKLQMNRPPGASQIDVSLEVEALSLPGAEATDKLPEGDSKRLKLASVEEYKKTFEERDLANVYTPPRPPRPPVAERAEPPKPPKFDDSEHARFSGLTGPTNDLEAWISVLTTGETLHLGAGDEIKIGALEGKIVSIESRSLVYEAGGKKFRVSLGEYLRKGKEIAADASTAVEKPEASPES